MSELKVLTNNRPRDLLYYHELPTKWQKEYADIEESRRDEIMFFIYRNWCYRLDDFVRINPGDSFNCNEAMKKWHGYAGDSYFSGTLVRYVTSDYGSGEQIIVGRFMS